MAVPYLNSSGNVQFKHSSLNDSSSMDLADAYLSPSNCPCPSNLPATLPHSHNLSLHIACPSDPLPATPTLHVPATSLPATLPWMAGGGVRGGTAYGATDEFGYFAVENKVSMYDFHATNLHLLGFDHEQLTYHHAGRDFASPMCTGT